MELYKTHFIRNNIFSSDSRLIYFSSHHLFFRKYMQKVNGDPDACLVINPDNLRSIKNGTDLHPHSLLLVNSPLHQIRNLNEVLTRLNSHMSPGATLLLFSHTAELTKKRILAQHRHPFNRLIYFFHFIFCRVLPKLSGFTEKLFTRLNKNAAKEMHSSEILGTVACNGFSIDDYGFEKDLLVIAAKKTRSKESIPNVSRSLIFTMPRIGRQGKMIKVYKFRTMHPYAEHLQDFMLEKHGLDKDGKFKNDFRIAGWGRILRKYWIDELPMIINLVKGDIKLVGVRPLSRKYFELYPGDVQQLRLKTRPGFIPPSYAYSAGSLEEIISLEKKYLLEHQQNPFMTDIKYFFRIFYKLLSRKIQSK